MRDVTLLWRTGCDVVWGVGVAVGFAFGMSLAGSGAFVVVVAFLVLACKHIVWFTRGL